MSGPAYPFNRQGTTVDIAPEDVPAVVNTGVLYWARPGASNNAFLYNFGAGSTPSNLGGIPAFLQSPILDYIAIGSESTNINFSIRFHYLLDQNITLLHTQVVTLPSGTYTVIFENLGIPFPYRAELATQLIYPSAKPVNVRVFAGVRGASV
jgi:hypothetical protein